MLNVGVKLSSWMGRGGELDFCCLGLGRSALPFSSSLTLLEPTPSGKVPHGHCPSFVDEYHLFFAKGRILKHELTSTIVLLSVLDRVVFITTLS